MQRSFLLLLVATTCIVPATSTSALHRTLLDCTFEAVGGPPSIRLATKAKGPISQAEWTTLTTVDLAGCVTDARITSLTVCINDCKGKAASVSGISATLTKEMKTMIANLPAGTSFTVKVEVKDGRGKAWEVPDATYVTAR